MYLACITITQSTIITSLIGINIGLTNVYQSCSTLFRRCVTLFWRCFNVKHWRCINVVQRWKSDVGFCFIFNVGSTLFQRSSTTLKQRWSDVEILAGLFLKSGLTAVFFYWWEKLAKFWSIRRTYIYLILLHDNSFFSKSIFDVTIG